MRFATHKATKCKYELEIIKEVSYEKRDSMKETLNELIEKSNLSNMEKNLHFQWIIAFYVDDRVFENHDFIVVK